MSASDSLSPIEETAGSPQGACFFTLRSRAYELADTGRYNCWHQVADALLAEGFLPSVIVRLDRDALAVMLVTRNCRRAAATIPSSQSRMRKWFARLWPRAS